MNKITDALGVAGATAALAEPAAAIFFRVLEGLAGNFLKEKADQTRGIIIEELGRSHLDSLSSKHSDTLISMIIRLHRANMEGCAKDNLRYIVRLVNGLEAQRPIRADEFSAYADRISSLMHEEMVVLATYMHLEKSGDYLNEEKLAFAVEEKLTTGSEPYFASLKDFSATCSAISRTGFLRHNGGLDGGVYVPTYHLRKIDDFAELADLFSL